MYASIYQPSTANPSAAVLDAERDILTEEGPHHVNGCYFASDADAATQRRWEAERRCAPGAEGGIMYRAYAPTLTVETLRLNTPHVNTQCVWCSKDIDSGDAVIEIAGRMMHDRPCRQEFEVCVYGDGRPGEQSYEPFEDGPSDPYYNHVYAQAHGIAERVVRIPTGVEL